MPRYLAVTAFSAAMALITTSHRTAACRSGGVALTSQFLRHWPRWSVLACGLPAALAGVAKREGRGLTHARSGPFTSLNSGVQVLHEKARPSLWSRSRSWRSGRSSLPPAQAKASYMPDIRCHLQ